jgi:hypothetical protein
MLSYQNSADFVKYVPSIGQDGNCAGLIIRLLIFTQWLRRLYICRSSPRNTNSACRLSSPQRALALCYKECGKYRLFVGWVVVGPRVEVEIGMGGFVVHSVAQVAAVSPVNIYVSLPFGLHRDLNVLLKILFNHFGKNAQ